MRLLYRILIAGVTLGLPAFAQFTAIPTPASAYTGSTTLIPITQPDCSGTPAPGNPTTLTSLSNGAQTVTFSTAMTVNTAGVFPNCGGGWASWGAPPNTESATPRVLDTTSTSLTMTLAVPSGTFGFEVEPASSCPISFPCPYNITATFFNGATQLGSISLNVNGNAGAMLEAAASATPITRVTIAAAPGSGGFGIAQLRYATATVPPATVPTLTNTALLALAFFLGAAGLWCRREASRAAGPNA